ncbi:MAG: Na+ dependent nucleoside transporter [Bacteroidetes bacterium]|nr:Na+ dependent nucleoside transporter [Bacteroidota bacterium]
MFKPLVFIFAFLAMANGLIAQGDSAATAVVADTVQQATELIQPLAKKDFKIESEGMSLASVLRGAMGLLFLIALSVVFSTNRRAINWRLVTVGVLLQVFIGILVLKVSFFQAGLELVSLGFTRVLGFTQSGVDFLFNNMDTGTMMPALKSFAFVILPTVIFFSALTSLLFFLGILQKVVFAMAWVMKRSMGLSGPESLAAAGNIFLGQTEAPLLVKPYIAGMSKSELMCLMSGGMATVAGGVLAAYVRFLGGGDPALEIYYAKHLITASVLSAPAAIVVSKIIVPDREKVQTELSIPKEKIGANFLEAISNGTGDGLKLAVNVGAMLLVFTAMVTMVNFMLQNLLGEWTGLNAEIIALTGGSYQGLNLQFLLGYIGAPIAWMIGVPVEDMVAVGQLVGQKTVLNEFYAYVELAQMKGAGAFVHEKSVIMVTYILCGFSNFASIGIQIGGIGSLAPARRSQLSELGFRAMLAGSLACLMTAAVAGMYY